MPHFSAYGKLIQPAVWANLAAYKASLDPILRPDTMRMFVPNEAALDYETHAPNGTPYPPDRILRHEGITLNVTKMEVTRRDAMGVIRRVNMLAMDYKILEVLMKGKGRIVSKDHLRQAADEMGKHRGRGKGIDTAIKRIRAGLGAPNLIATTYGEGYSLLSTEQMNGLRAAPPSQAIRNGRRSINRHAKLKTSRPE